MDMLVESFNNDGDFAILEPHFAYGTVIALIISAARGRNKSRGETTDDHINQKDKRSDNSIGIIAGGRFDR
jgi:hypothetical protein